MNKRPGKAVAAGDWLSLGKALSQDRPPQALFFCGEDVTLREWLLDGLRSWHRKRGCETTTVSAEEDGAAAVLDGILQGGLFAPLRFLAIRDAEFLLEKKSERLSGKDAERLEEALSKPPPGTSLALISGRADRKREALERAFTRTLSGWMEVVVCSPLSVGDFSRFCADRAAESGIKLRPEDLAALSAFTGGRAGSAAREIERIAVSGADQGSQGGLAGWGAVFSWVDDLLRGKHRSPGDLDVSDSDGALMTLGLVRSRYRLALDLSAGKSGLPPLFPDTRAALEAAVRRLGKTGLENVVLGLARLDRAVRSGSLDAGEALASASLLGSSPLP